MQEVSWDAGGARPISGLVRPLAAARCIFGVCVHPVYPRMAHPEVSAAALAEGVTTRLLSLGKRERYNRHEDTTPA